MMATAKGRKQRENNSTWLECHDANKATHISVRMLQSIMYSDTLAT